MADGSAIEWTHSTWNPVTGCTKVSTGCDHCYAERFSERFRGVAGHPFENGFDLTLRPERIDQPKHWRRPRLIFVNSMSDLFHKEIPDEFLSRVFDTMETAHWHVYQVLTKRSSPMREFVNRRYTNRPIPPNIWLGVSIESLSVLSRLRHLKQTKAAVRFVSFEPLLGPLAKLDLGGIHWAIAGGESGPGARPVDVAWLRELRDQCVSQNVAFFFKQWGGRTPKSGGNSLDGRQWLQYPESTISKSTSISIHPAGSPADGGVPPDNAMEVGSWAREKLECLRKYLHAYTTILSKQRFKGYFYIDAFAGPGALKIRRSTDVPEQLLLDPPTDEARHDRSEYINGSPRVALELEHPFTDYVFVEVDRERVKQLESLKSEFQDVRIHIRQQDCNGYLRDFLDKIKTDRHRWRGVIFLDPFGMNVPWSTIAEIGNIQTMEVLINFPVGMAIQRLLKRSGKFTDRERARLDSYFGTSEWFDLLYEKTSDLFGDQVDKLDHSGDVLVKWYRNRLKSVFGYVTEAREVQTDSGRPLYYLIFAGPNETGARIANDVLRQGARQVR